MAWQLQQAQEQFGEFLNATLNEGPQVVARDGEEMAVLVPIDQWKRLRSGHATLKDRTQDMQKPTLKDLLLGPGPRFGDMMIPNRRRSRYRKTPKL